MNASKSIVSSFALVIACIGISGCSSDDTSEPLAHLSAQLAEWHSKRPTQYVIVTCGTGFDPKFCVRAAIEGDDVKTAKTSGFSRTPLTDANPADVKEPIGDLFEQARHALDNEKSCEVRLEFDPRYGYLSSYYSDCGEEGGGRAVECFAPGTLDLAACPYE